MLRNALFAFGASLTIGLPHTAVAQTMITAPSVTMPSVTMPQIVAPSIAVPAVTVQPVVVQPVAVRPVAVRPVAVQRVVTQTTYANQDCYDPNTDGPSNTSALPLCAVYLDQAAGGEQYATIDRGSLANTQVCPAGVDCGPPADLTNVRPFYGTAGQQVPATVVQPMVAQPVVVTPPPAPVVAVAPPAPVAIPPAPPVFAPVTALPGAGLGGVGFAAASLLAVAAGVGIFTLANDSDSASGTN